MSGKRYIMLTLIVRKLINYIHTRQSRLQERVLTKRGIFHYDKVDNFLRRLNNPKSIDFNRASKYMNNRALKYII